MIGLETEQEDDGRWIAEMPDLPGAMAYGESKEDAVDRVRVLKAVILRDREKHGEPIEGNDP